MSLSPAEVIPQLATALLDKAGVPGPIGALIIAAIFPDTDGVPGYFATVLDQIKNIVHSELVENDLNDLSGKLQSVITDLSGDYKAMKEQADPDIPALFHRISDHSETMTEIIGRLTRDDLALPGLSLFLTAASVNISVWQEMALVDPSVDDPRDSAHVATISAAAEHAAAFASQQWVALKAARVNAVTVVHKSRRILGIGTDAYYWHDAVTDADGTHHPEQEEANAECGVHQAAAVDSLRADLGDPDAIVRTWREVSAQPLSGSSIVHIQNGIVSFGPDQFTNAGEAFNLVLFPSAFSKPPSLSVSLYAVNISPGGRGVSLVVGTVAADSFELTCKAMPDTTVNFVGASWIAHSV